MTMTAATVDLAADIIQARLLKNIIIDKDHSIGTIISNRVAEEAIMTSVLASRRRLQFSNLRK